MLNSLSVGTLNLQPVYFGTSTSQKERRASLPSEKHDWAFSGFKAFDKSLLWLQSSRRAEREPRHRLTPSAPL